MATIAEYVLPVRKAWSKLWGALFEPKLDDDELESLLREARESHPLPVIWLLGKTQSGKTAIIRAMTGSTSAEIGKGYRPCTRTSQFYDFPLHAPIVRFLDTRGLGEVDYDPTEDLAYCAQQSHLVLAVVRAMEPPDDALLEILGRLRRQYPDRAVLVAQTCLHEAYPAGAPHVLPYPFNDTPLPDAVPSDLRRGLVHQRTEFEKHTIESLRFVPIDLTSDDDPLEPRDYGLEQLWDAVEHELPRGLRGLLASDPGVQGAKARAAEMQIRGYAVAATLLGGVPIAGVAGVPAIQAKMLHSIAAIYGLNLGVRLAGEFMSALGTGIALGFGVRWVGREVVKLVPVWGQTAGVVWAAAASGTATYALGQAAWFYFQEARKGGQVDEAVLRRVYKDAFKRARTFAQSNPDTVGA